MAEIITAQSERVTKFLSKMKKIKLLIMNRRLFILMMAICVAVSCSKDEDSLDNLVRNDELIGSEWKRVSEHLDIDDGSWEKGNHLLTFNNSSEATEVCEYNGKGWEWSYEDGDRFKPYSGTHTSFFSYKIDGKKIILTDVEDGDVKSYTLSGGKLVCEDIEWTLVKKGSGNNATEPDDIKKITWNDLHGVWIDRDEYYAMLETTDTYQRQNMSSNVYTRESHDLSFRLDLGGIQFSSTGKERNLWIKPKTWKNDLVIKKIFASDNKTVYWTDIENDSYSSYTLLIRDNKIYKNGVVKYEIANNGDIYDVNNEIFYVKVETIQ